MTDARPTTGDEPLERETLATVRRLAASPLVYVGAITVVAVTEIVQWLPLPNFWAALSTLPIALALLYGQLAILVLWRRRRGRAPPARC